MKHKQSILIVDDQPRNLFALERTLADLDVTVVQAQTGNDALAATLNHEFALGLLDVRMPEMDGLELAELLRSDEKTKHLPLIFLTASHGSEEKIFRGYEAGAVDYLVKPYSAGVLIAKVKVFLELDRQQAELREYRLHLEELVEARTSDLSEATKALSLERDSAIARAEELAQALQTLKQTEAELSHAQKMEAVGRLAGGVAHDFANILVCVLGYAEFLGESAALGEAEQGYLGQITKAATRATALIRQLMAFSRRETVEPAVLQLNAVVGELRKMLDRLISKDITIVTRLDPAAHQVLADMGQLEQVIVNLVVNARDAMPHGGSLVIETANAVLDDSYVRDHVEARPGPFLVLSVSDTGCGMDAATRARIFEPFFTTKQAGKGTGLGLATVYGIVKQSGGFMWVDSEVDKGTTFKLFLPRAEVVPGLHPAVVAGPTARGGKETILVVDNDPDVRELAVLTLQRLGYTALGSEGLDGAKESAEALGEIHLLVTGVVMAGGGGRSVSAVVRAQHPEVKVLYMSGYSDEAVIQRGGLEADVVFLNKPFTRESLGRKVREVLDSRQGWA